MSAVIVESPDGIVASGSGIAIAFGSVILQALSQTGFQGARSAYLENSGCFVTATYFDSSGFPFVPSSVYYRIDDVVSGFNIVPWTSVTPGLSNQITIITGQNSMVSLSRQHECHQVLFKIADGYNEIYYERVLFDLIRLTGFTQSFTEFTADSGITADSNIVVD